MTFQFSAGGEKPTTRRRLGEGWSWTLSREGTSTRTMRALMAGLLVGGISVACSPLPQRTFDGSTDEGESGEGGTGGEPMGRSEGGGKPSLAGAGSSGGAAGTTGTPTCAEDEYDDGASCQKLTICARGELVSSQPSKTADRACRACSAGTFSDALNAASCKAWKTCTSSQTQTMPGSATSDVVCVDKPACSSAKERTCTTQCPCASAEGVCTASNQCVSGSTCVAGSGKKVGRAGDTCLATHCNNDQLDTDETSVDCGGECGCRATYEIVTYKGLTAGAKFIEINAMSRDGKRLVGSFARDQGGYPAAVAYDGTVTELESYGKGGAAYLTNIDGSVVVGYSACTDPPACTLTGKALWSGSAGPQLLELQGDIEGMSSSGTVLAGEFLDTSTSSPSGFISSGIQRTFIPQLMSVAGVTPDGKYVAGILQNGVQGGLWFAQTQAITKFGASDWTSIALNGVNGTDPAVVGFGYIASSDSYLGFRWKGGVLTMLDVLAAGASSTPYAVSTDGSTVVGVTGTNDFQQAFIWTDQDKLRLVVDELRARGVEPPLDFQLIEARFLSDDGKTIVGQIYGDPPMFWRVVLE